MSLDGTLVIIDTVKMASESSGEGIKEGGKVLKNIKSNLGIQQTTLREVHCTCTIFVVCRFRTLLIFTIQSHFISVNSTVKGLAIVLC